MYQVKNIMWRNNYWIERIGFWDQIEENEEVVYESVRFFRLKE